MTNMTGIALRQQFQLSSPKSLLEILIVYLDLFIAIVFRYKSMYM